MRRIVVAALLICASAIAPAQAAPDVSFGGVSYSDARHGWAVFATPCGTSQALCARVEATDDGGRVWRPLARLRVCGGTAELCIPTVRRVTATVGFVWGARTMMTSDGGRTWVRLDMPRVEALAAVPRGVFALTYSHFGCPGACNVVLRHAGVGDHRFTAVGSFRNPTRGNFDALVGAGSDLYAVGFGRPAGGAGTAYARLSISRDGGRTWSLRGDPCRVPGGSGLSTPGGSEWDTWRLAATGRYAAVMWVERRNGSHRSWSRAMPAARSRACIHRPPTRTRSCWGPTEASASRTPLRAAAAAACPTSVSRSAAISGGRGGPSCGVTTTWGRPPTRTSRSSVARCERPPPSRCGGVRCKIGRRPGATGCRQAGDTESRRNCRRALAQAHGGRDAAGAPTTGLESAAGGTRRSGRPTLNGKPASLSIVAGGHRCAGPAAPCPGAARAPWPGDLVFFREAGPAGSVGNGRACATHGSR